MIRMHPQSIFAIRQWNLPEILFLAAACFAIGAVGFFLAVFLQLQSSGGSSTGTYANTQDVPVEDKARVLSILSHSAPEATNTTSVAPNSSQASANDALAAQKLKILQQIGSK